MAVDTANLISRYCSEFEEALDSGESPDVERFIAQAPEPIQEQLTISIYRLQLKRTRLREAGSVDLPSANPVISRPSRYPENAGSSLDRSSDVPGGSQSPDDTMAMPSIERYQFVRYIAGGGFGRVYEAQDRILHKRVAVKVLVPRQTPLLGSTSNESRDRSLLQEAWHLADLSHEHIVQVLDAGRMADGGYFIVTEYIDGGTLRDLARAKQLTDQEIVSLIIAMASALQHAHERKITHRDIKPQNILVDQAGKPYVVDFGLALHEDDYGMTPATSGTIYYMSPEQASGNSHLTDGRSDIFSLGVVFYELLRGVLPFRGSQALEILSQITQLDPQPIRQTRVIDPELERICMKCLAKKPADRYPSAGDLVADLRTFSGPTQIQSLSLSQRRTNWRRWVVAPVILACSVPLLYLALAGKSPTQRVQPHDSAAGQTKPASPVPVPVPVPEPVTTVHPGPAVEAKSSPTSKRSAPTIQQAGNPSELASHAYQFFETYCRKCHHDEQKVEELDLLSHASVLNFRTANDEPLAVPGKARESALLGLISGSSRTMPPKRSVQPSADEITRLEEWIDAGAPAWPTIQFDRPRVSLTQMFQAMRDDLKSHKPSDRPFRRYLSLVHLNNDTRVPETELTTTRTAASKLLNSLSWEKDLAVISAVGPGQTLLAFDLRDLGWTRKTWAEVLAHDPYQINYRPHPEVGPAQLEVEQLANQALAETLWTRADWFVATASRPPLYHTLLDLPKTTADLELKLGVDTVEDFRSSRLKRAGMIKSGVSRQNRVLDRHPLRTGGAYWKSYDFGPGRQRSDLLQFPLGPRFPHHPFEAAAFEFDGGEMIFNLPNGLQAYFLATSGGKRLCVAPVEIVEDSLQTGGGTQIINGLSCMACHQEGIKPFHDDLRQNAQVGGPIRDKLLELVPPAEEFDRVVKEDQERFQRAVLHLNLTNFAGVLIPAGPEPVGAVARRYDQPLDLERLARELYLEDPAVLAAAFPGNPELRRLGLNAILKAGTVKRGALDGPPLGDAGRAGAEGGTTVYQTLAQALGNGTPIEVSQSASEKK